jgi:hypothetical protein
MKRVAIVQSNYVPWRGYFDLISCVDEFILLDDVQYTTRDWRNRNLIKTPEGTAWLTIPVRGGQGQRIDEVEIADPRWGEAHLRTLAHAYRAAPCFERCEPWLSALYLDAPAMLSDVNRSFLERICAELGIGTTLTHARDYGAEGAKSSRLLELCLRAGATEYVSGPAARAYLDRELFAGAGVRVRWFEYPAYPEYPQLHPPFEPRVSILDLLFHTGGQAPRYLRANPDGALALAGGDE